MFPNVNAERARLGLTLDEMAKQLNMKRGTLSLKLNKKSPITLDEAKKIKRILKTDMSIDELFREEDE